MPDINVDDIIPKDGTASIDEVCTAIETFGVDFCGVIRGIIENEFLTRVIDDLVITLGGRLLQVAQETALHFISPLFNVIAVLLVVFYFLRMLFAQQPLKDTFSTITRIVVIAILLGYIAHANVETPLQFDDDVTTNQNYSDVAVNKDKLLYFLWDAPEALPHVVLGKSPKKAVELVLLAYTTMNVLIADPATNSGTDDGRWVSYAAMVTGTVFLSAFMILYVLTKIGIALLLALLPLFLLALITKKTQSYFTNWLNYYLSFSLTLLLVTAFSNIVSTLLFKYLIVIVAVDFAEGFTSLLFGESVKVISISEFTPIAVLVAIFVAIATLIPSLVGFLTKAIGSSGVANGITSPMGNTDKK